MVKSAVYTFDGEIRGLKSVGDPLKREEMGYTRAVGTREVAEQSACLSS